MQSASWFSEAFIGNSEISVDVELKHKQSAFLCLGGFFMSLRIPTTNAGVLAFESYQMRLPSTCVPFGHIQIILCLLRNCCPVVYCVTGIYGMKIMDQYHTL